MRKLLVLSSFLILVGCSANQYAGINHAKADFNDNGQLQEIVFYGGKESGEVTLKVPLPGGAVAEFTGKDVRAFEGQAVRAEVEKAIAEAGAQIAPDVVNAIVDAIVGM